MFSQAGLGIVSTQVLPPKAEPHFDRIALVVRADGELLALQSALMVLDNQKPSIFIDEMTLQLLGPMRGAPAGAGPRLGGAVPVVRAQGASMRVGAIPVLFAVNLGLAAVLVAMWVQPDGTIRDIRWTPPTPVSPNLSGLLPDLDPARNQSDVGQFLAILERPLFSATRRPPPPADPSARDPAGRPLRRRLILWPACWSPGSTAALMAAARSCKSRARRALSASPNRSAIGKWIPLKSAASRSGETRRPASSPSCRFGNCLLPTTRHPHRRRAAISCRSVDGQRRVPRPAGETPIDRLPRTSRGPPLHPRGPRAPASLGGAPRTRGAEE